MQRYVLLAPFRRVGSTGEIARNLLRGLLPLCEAGGIDTAGPGAETGLLDLGDLAPHLDGPVRVRGATAVYHAPLHELQTAAARHPTPGAERRVACVDWPGERLPERSLEVLRRFDEVWVPAHLQRELLAGSGVPRRQVFTIPPGVEAPGSAEVATRSPCLRFVHLARPRCAHELTPLLSAYGAEFARARRGDEPVELLVQLRSGSDRAAFEAVWAEVLRGLDLAAGDGPRIVVTDGILRRRELHELLRSCDLYVSTEGTARFPLACLEAMACGLPVAALDPGGTSELLHERTALLVPREAERGLRDVLRQAFEERSSLSTLAGRGLEQAIAAYQPSNSARAVLERHSSPLRPPPALLDRILQRLGLRGPDEWIAGSRARLELCGIERDEDDWRTPLRGFLGRYGPQDDVTLCIWLDDRLAGRLQSLTAEIQAEIESAQGPRGPGDVLLLSAPLEHVPWQRVAGRAVQTSS